MFFEKQVFTIFPQCVNRLPFHTQPSDAKKETIFGCTLSIFRYPSYYFLTTKYSALNYLFEPELCISPFLNLVVPGALYTILTVLLGDPDGHWRGRPGCLQGVRLSRQFSNGRVLQPEIMDEVIEVIRHANLVRCGVE